MLGILQFTVITVCFHLVYGLSSTRHEVPSQERYNFFDTELFKILSQEHKGNLVISPISVKLLLGMVMEGADGKTAEEIRAALRMPRNREAARKEFETWLSLLQTEKSPNHLKLATRIFLSNKYNVNSEYKNLLKKHYKTGITAVKFEDAKEASRTINGWVSKQTGHLISSIVKENLINPDVKLMLMSAVYFKGMWSNPFTGNRNNVRCFYTEDNQCVKSRMMTETSHYEFGYISKLDAQAVKLPYKGGKYFMLLLLPTKRNGIQELSRDVIHVSMRSILSSMKMQEVFIQIPRFEISYEHDLIESLKKLHVAEMFGRSANFSNIVSFNSSTLSVNHVFHSAKIKVDEEGSEAAAATGAFFVPLMGGTTTSFIATHPFLFFIMDSETSTVIFAGKLSQPKSVEEPESNTGFTSGQGFGNSSQLTESPDGIPHPTTSSPSNSRTPPKPGKYHFDEHVDVGSSSDLQEFSPSRRGHAHRPKFRSIKGAFPQRDGPSQRPHFYFSPEQLNNLLNHSPVKKTNNNEVNASFENNQNSGYTSEIFGPENQRQAKEDKREKALKGQNSRDPTSDTWRHHILFFS